MSVHARHQLGRPAFSLIEVVIAVIVLAIAVPPTLNLMDSAAAGRADAINTTRATILATCVLETVTADINSDAAGLGFDALADDDAYLNTPTTGLIDRLDPIVEPYTSVGFSYTVTIGPLVSSDGTVSATVSENIFRVITVSVGYTSATSDPYLLPVSTMVSAL
ncbi:MAG: prepilin-type N-terminal cleavage/methylation domain-containing protein [Phycisphaerales bacterium]|nr:prepilin-type N-terminal cleavage/methylation domain-containing protein [Phycisphaerales bacterium]